MHTKLTQKQSPSAPGLSDHEKLHDDIEHELTSNMMSPIKLSICRLPNK